MKERCGEYATVNGRSFRCLHGAGHVGFHRVTYGIQDARWLTPARSLVHQSTERQENR